MPSSGFANSGININRFRARFDKKDSESGEVIDEVNRVLDPKTNEIDRSFPAFQPNWGNIKTIFGTGLSGLIQNAIPITGRINYLLDVLRWNEAAVEAVSGEGSRQNELSLDALYSIRKTGRDLFDRMPPGLVGIQPSFAERNKWLEQRTRVRQLMFELNGSMRSPGKNKSEKQSAIRRGIAELDKMELLPTERDALSLIKKKQGTKEKAERLFLVVNYLFAINTCCFISCVSQADSVSDAGTDDNIYSFSCVYHPR